MELSEKEKKIGLSGKKLDAALSEIYEKGYVVFENYLDKNLVSDLHSELMKVFEKKQRRMGIEPVPEYSLIDQPGFGGNHGSNRWNLRLPSIRPFLDNNVVGNPVVISIVNSILGADATIRFVACDMNLPKSSIQSLHRDRSSFAFIMNIPLVDTTIENGATQIFPGTHRLPKHSFDLNGKLPFVPEWPPKSWVGEFLTVPAGSVILRDVRVAHRGMVNSSQKPRSMINVNIDKVCHDTVPYHWITSLLEFWGRKQRKISIDAKNFARLKYWNIQGQRVAFYAKTDRYGKRKIPQSVWESLGDDARNLLRYAEVENIKTEAYRRESSIRSLNLVPSLLKEIFEVNRTFKDRNVSAKPSTVIGKSDKSLISALTRNKYAEEDEALIRQALKELGRNV